MRIEQTRKLLAAGILPSPAPTQDVEALRQRLAALRLVFAAEGLGDLLSRAVKDAWNPAEFLDELLRFELERQEERRIPSRYWTVFRNGAGRESRDRLRRGR